MTGIEQWFQQGQRVQDDQRAQGLLDTDQGGMPDFPEQGRAPAREPQQPDPISAWRQQGDQQLRQTLQQASQKNPDTAAEIDRLRARTGLPGELIERNLDTVREHAAAQDFDPRQFRQDFPALAGLLDDPDNATLAQDDLESLQLLEGTLKLAQQRYHDSTTLPERVWNRVREGALGLRQSLLGLPLVDLIEQGADARMTGDFMAARDPITGMPIPASQVTIGEEQQAQLADAAGAMGRAAEAEMARRIAPLQARAAQIEQRPATAAMMQAESWGEVFDAFLTDPLGIIADIGISSQTQQLPSLAIIMATRNPGLGIAASAGNLYALEAGGGVIQYLAGQGIDTSDPEAIVRALEDDGVARAAVEYAEQRGAVMATAGGLATGVASRMLVPGGAAGQSVGRDAANVFVAQPFAQGTIGASAEGSLQLMQEGEIAPGELFAEFIGEFAGAPLEAGSFTAERMMQQRRTPAVVEDAGRAAAAAGNAETLEAMGEVARGSRLRERHHEKFREFVERMRDGSGIESLQIPVERWNELFQSAGQDPAELAAQVTGDPRAYQEAMATGGDLVVPLAEYMDQLAGGELHAELSRDIRLHPGDMTQREAEAWMASTRDNVEEYLGTLAQPADDRSTVVYDDVLGQLLSAGRERSTAEREARLMQSVFRSLGERTGQDPAELFQRYNIGIRRPMPEVLQQLRDTDMAIDPLLDRLRAGDIPTQRDAFGPSLMEFLRERGIQDEGGELAARDADAGRRAFQRALIREDGMSLDDAAQAAAEANYLPGLDRSAVTYQDLLDAIDRELRGEPVYSQDAGDSQTQDMIATLDELGDYLNELGVDLSSLDNAAVRALLAGDEAPPPADGESARTLDQPFDGSETARTPLAEGVTEIEVDGQMRPALNSEGRPIHWSEEGIRNFWRWFGDSQVVDEQGRPKVVYHGTSDDVGAFDLDNANRFDTGWLGTGVYLTDSSRIANSYANMKGGMADPNVMPLYARIETPYQATMDEKRRLAGMDREASDEFTADLLERGSDGAVLELPSGEQELVVFDPAGVKSAIGNRGTFDPTDPTILNQAAFHGTPHRFDRFSLDAIGTGEGAQAYGWGLYFAGKREIAEYYRDALTAAINLREVDQRAYDMLEENLDTLVGRADEAMVNQEAANYMTDGQPDWMQDEVAEALDQAREKMRDQGQLYEVDVPENSELLAWDSRLDEQPESVQQALASLDESFDPRRIVHEPEMRGSAIYERLKATQGSPRAASQALSEAGIPGLRYLDATSRDGGDGTYNYVVWDEERVTVEAVNDELRQAEAQEAVTTLNQEGPRLSAIHNISADGLAYADRMGGLAVPSIGVVTEDAGGVEGFGEITLIGRRGLADPSREAVFSADAYTVRFPRPEFKGYSEADYRRLREQLEPYAERFDSQTILATLREHGKDSPDARELVTRALNSSPIMAMYLESQGQEVQPVMRAADPGEYAPLLSHSALAEWLDANVLADAYVASMDGDHGPMQRFTQALREAYIDTNLALVPEARRERQLPLIEMRFDTNWIGGHDSVQDSRFNEIAREVESLGQRARQEVDPLATQGALQDQIADEPAFKQWVEDTFVAPMGEPRIKVGRRKLPYTLENIVEAMTRERAIAGREETMTFGAGQARAANAEQFQTLERMREAAADQIRSPAEYEAAKAETETLLEDFRGRVAGYTTIENYRGQPDTWEGLDGAMRAVARYLGYKRRGRAAFERALRAEQFDVAAIKSQEGVAERQAAAERRVNERREDVQRLQEQMDALDANDPRREPASYRLQQAEKSLARLETEAGRIGGDIIALGMQAAEALEQAPVPYFEAKPQRAVALDEFAGAVIPEGAPQSVRETLANHGLPFVEYGDDATRSEAVRQFREQLANQGEEVLFQRQGNQPRGRITFPQSRRFFNIELLERADLSTFIHESGHLYLEILTDLVQQPDPPQQLADDFQTILDWLGVEDADSIGTEQHEQWARGFEAYIMEGKAPSAEMRSVFARFRAWLVAIYRTVASLNVELTDEVRGVMDRLVATDQEISDAASETQFQPLFGDAQQAGMSDAEYRAYQQAAERARTSAEEEVTGKVMREYQRERKQWWREAKARMRDEVAAEINQRPEYVAMAVLGRGKLPDGSPLPEGMEPFKLNRAALADRYGKEFLKRLPRPYVYSREGGVHPDVAADAFGYRSGDELVQALINARPRRQLIDAETERRMLETYGDMLNDGTLADEAMTALHSDQQGQMLQAELRALHRRTGRQPTPTQVIRDAAQRIIAEKRVREVQPYRYLQAEQKASREAFNALAEGDHARAAEAKQRQLLNHHLYREAQQARADVDAVVETMARYRKKSVRQRIAKAGEEYLQQIDALATRYEFRRATTLRQIDRRRSLEAWVAEQQEEGFTLDLPEALLDDARVVNYREVPVEELRGLHDAVKQIEHLARTKNRLLAARDQREFEATVDSVVASIDSHRQRDPSRPPLAETWKDRIASWAKDAHAWHTKPEFLFRWLDGDVENGPVWQALFRPIADAEVAEQALHREVTGKLKEIMGAYTRQERAEWYGTKFHIPEVNQTFTKAAVISVALNWGNEYNRQVMMEGYGWNDRQVQAILQHMDARDWQMVQETWDLIDTLWPHISQLEKDLNGIAPQKVEALAFAPPGLPDGSMTLRGGYYPIKYDARASTRTFQREERSGDKLFENSYSRPATRQGHTKERQGSGGQVVRLDLNVLSEHFSQVIHDVTHRRAVMDVNRLANNKEVREAIEQTAGRELYRQIKPWLQAVANEMKQPESFWEKLVGRARTGGTVVNMGLKATTALAQPLGFFSSVDLLGERWAWKGLTDFLGPNGPQGTGSYRTIQNMQRATEFVKSRSEAMRNRQVTFDRDVRDTLNRMTQETRAQELGRFYFYFTGMLDMAVSVPTWLGAYRKAMEGAVETIAAGNEGEAIAYADSIVRMSQSAGGVKDLARIQRGGQVQRAFIMFYSFFSAAYNQSARRISQAQRGEISLPRLAASAMYIWIVPALLGELIAGRGPEEEEGWLEWSVTNGILYPAGMVVGLRDVSNAVLTPFGYDASPAYDAFDMTARAARIPLKALDPEQEVTRGDVKAAFLATSYWAALPGRQAWITGEYIFDVVTGEADPETPQEFVRNLFFTRPISER